MSTFNRYAQYYDLLYKDKDYAGEVDYIDSLLKELQLTNDGLLELGCGTAKHAILLSQRGYHVHGVDMSADMIEAAQYNIQAGDAENVKVEKGDIRSFRTSQKFAAVLSLFHVMSYQNSYAEVEQVFDTAAAHLANEGYFVFDCWHGPAVLTDPPVVRVKRMENEQITVTRIAEPNLIEQRNIVEVHYDIFVQDQISKQIEQLKELHSMRYFFEEELVLIAARKGFKLLKHYEFGTHAPSSINTWSVIYVWHKQHIT